MSQVARHPHEYTDLMSRKSHTAQLPIINANETKHEDCLKIMDTYENMLSELYTEAHGIVFTCQYLKGGGQSLHLQANVTSLFIY